MASTEEEKQSPSKRLKIIIGIVLVLLLSGFAGGGTYWYLNRDPAEVAAKNRQVVTLPSMTVNLADTGGKRYLRTTITLEYTNPKLKEELDTSMYKVKDGALQVLRSTYAYQLQEGQDVEQIRQALLTEINSRLHKGQITALYFEELLVQ